MYAVQLERLCQLRCQVLGLDAEPAAHDMALFDDLRHDALGQVDGDGEAQACPDLKAQL